MKKKILGFLLIFSVLFNVGMQPIGANQCDDRAEIMRQRVMAQKIALEMARIEREGFNNIQVSINDMYDASVHDEVCMDSCCHWEVSTSTINAQAQSLCVRCGWDVRFLDRMICYFPTGGGLCSFRIVRSYRICQCSTHFLGVSSRAGCGNWHGNIYF